MAAAFAKAAEDELSCPICLELFVGQYVPKDLPGCDHVVCIVCLKNLSKDLKGETRIINCPECRKETKLPKDGVNAFKTNRKVRNLAEKHPRDVKETARDVNDETCGDAKDETPQGAKPKVPMCPDHEAERMHYYCTSCDSVACLACLILKHPGHAIEGIKDRYKVLQQAMKDQLIEAKSKIALCADGVDTLQDIREQVCKQQTLEENRIEKKLEELKRSGQEEKGLLDQQLIKCGQHMTHIESIYSAAATAHANATEYEYLTQHSSLCYQLKLITIKKPEIDTIVMRGGMTCQAVFLDKALRKKSEHDLDKTSNSKRSTTLTLIQTIATPDGTVAAYGTANSMAWSASGMLVLLLRRTRQVAIYRKRNDQYKMDQIWKLDPWWMASVDKDDPSQRCLPVLGGITFGPQNKIFVVAFDHIHIYSLKGHLIDQFTMGVLGSLTSINVTNEGSKAMLIVGHAGEPDNNSIFVASYSARKLCRTIDAIAPPNCTTLIPDGTHSCIAISGDGDNVSVLQIGNGIEKLRIHDMQMVSAICYHEQSKSLLAVTKSGSCIEQYCCVSGKKLACLLESGFEEGEIWDVAVSADGILAVLCGVKNVIRLYQID